MPPKFRRDYEPLGVREPECQGLLDGDDSDEELIGVGTSNSRDPKVNHIQGQVHEVMGVMQSNIGRVLDRGERLDELQDKSDNLASNADIFRSRAGTLKNRMWWKECKMRILVGVVVIIVLLIIIVPIIIHMKKNGEN